MLMKNEPKPERESETDRETETDRQTEYFFPETSVPMTTQKMVVKDSS